MDDDIYFYILYIVEHKDQAMHRDSQAPYQTADQTDYHHVYRMTQQRRHSRLGIKTGPAYVVIQDGSDVVTGP